jgi:thiol:disulfide interchange protein
VDGLETEFAGKLRVLRVDVQDPAGSGLALRYHLLSTPTFVFFDAQGVEQWRMLGRIDRARVAQALAAKP